MFGPVGFNMVQLKVECLPGRQPGGPGPQAGGMSSMFKPTDGACHMSGILRAEYFALRARIQDTVNVGSLPPPLPCYDARGRNLAMPAPQKFHWWYDHNIDWMLLNPNGSMKDCALHLGRSYAYLTLIVNSDLFKQRLAERRKDVNERLSNAVEFRAKSAATKSLELLLSRMEERPEQFKNKELLDVAE